MPDPTNLKVNFSLRAHIICISFTNIKSQMTFFFSVYTYIMTHLHTVFSVLRIPI
jgi:hypothetical protein